MKIRRFGLYGLALALALFGCGMALAQDGNPPMSVVSLYHVAPGKHLEFLKWMQAQEAVSREAGVPAAQWYAHLDGDNWDYMAVSPATTDAQDKKVGDMMKQKGMATGMKASLQFRTLIMDHTDTYSMGPQSIDDLVKAATQ